MELDAQHAAECSAERQEECRKRDADRADKDGIFWARIVAAEATLTGIRANLNFLKWVVPILITVLGTVGLVVAKYAIVGAITLELDKRIPAGMHLNVEKISSQIHYAEAPLP